MMKTFYPVLVLGLWSLGCSTVKTVEIPGATFYPFINAQGAAGAAVLVENDGERMRVRRLHVAEDSTSFTLVATYEGKRRVRSDGTVLHVPGQLKLRTLDRPEPRSVPTNRIQEIQFPGRDHTVGAVTGLALGVVSGAAVGFGIAQADCPGCPSDEKMGWGMMAAAAFGSVGGIVGLLVGAAVGSSKLQVYRMPQTRTEDREVATGRTERNVERLVRGER